MAHWQLFSSTIISSTLAYILKCYDVKNFSEEICFPCGKRGGDGYSNRLLVYSTTADGIKKLIR